jgi:hypothetical protein
MKSPGLMRPGLFGSRLARVSREDQRSTPNVRTVECETPPLVPVIVIGKVPVGAFLATVRVKCDVPEPVMETGLKLPVTPDGMPVADKVTAESKPPATVEVTTANPLWPRSRSPDVGETEMLKEPVVAAVTVSDTVAVCVIPPPVPVTVIE